ncbi:cell wall hydrolase [Sphingobium nicotianae]|uniref:Cell wall hydrolase n=1 Tax=Sphingobium nicotianae TaxID=2782607 RepID=A0A9X1ISH4_9SPHN|nr:cell wall hydrolase [Sphingobium nicotianae]MBT2188596.1 cell wall hydrolase [Sphingobium nicotianae]
MPKNIVVAALAAFGMLSSTFALAEVTTDIATPTENSLEAPVIIADASVALEDAVEPGKESNFVQPTPRPSTADGVDTLAELVAESGGRSELDAEANCLASAIYYEARSESLSGQLAVAHVVIQRARSGRFPSSLCGVVTQPGQFSFVRSGHLPAAPVNSGQWKTATAIARIAQQGSWQNPVKGALYFHAANVAPGWAKERVTRIGGHVFYR